MKKIMAAMAIVGTTAFGSTLERYNEGMGKFNQGVDRYILTPVGK